MNGQIGTTDPGPGYGCNLGNDIYGKWLGYQETYNPTDKRAYFDNTLMHYAINYNNNATTANCAQTNNNTLVSTGQSCVVTNNYNGKVITGNGTIFKYSGICNVPLDNNIFIFFLLSISVFLILKKPQSLTLRS